MATKLDKTLKREIEIDGQSYMLALSPEGVKLTQKGYRKGSEMTWKQILSGGSAGGPTAGGSMAGGGMAGSGTPGGGTTGGGTTGSGRGGGVLGGGGGGNGMMG